MEDLLNMTVAAGNVTETVEEVKEVIEKEPNELMKLDPAYFLTDHAKRLRKLKRIKGSEMMLVEYLEALAKIEENGLVYTGNSKFLPKNQHYTSQSNALIWLGNKNHQYQANYYKYRSTRLPFCCGVTEYGDFLFVNCKITNQDLMYNLMLDLIRINASANRVAHSGAFSVINYFINTPFMTVLESRDDLTFVKEFQNPKTNAKLKMFMFDTKI